MSRAINLIKKNNQGIHNFTLFGFFFSAMVIFNSCGSDQKEMPKPSHHYIEGHFSEIDFLNRILTYRIEAKIQKLITDESANSGLKRKIEVVDSAALKGLNLIKLIKRQMNEFGLEVNFRDSTNMFDSALIQRNSSFWLNASSPDSISRAKQLKMQIEDFINLVGMFSEVDDGKDSNLIGFPICDGNEQECITRSTELENMKWEMIQFGDAPAVDSYLYLEILEMNILLNEWSFLLQLQLDIR